MLPPSAEATHRRDDGPLNARFDSLTPGSAVRISGRLVEEPQVKLSGLGVVPESVEGTGTGGGAGGDQRPVRPRAPARLAFPRPSQAAAGKRCCSPCRPLSSKGLREYAVQQGGTELHTAKLSGQRLGVRRGRVPARLLRLLRLPRPVTQFYKQLTAAAGIDRALGAGWPSGRSRPALFT